MNNLKKDLRDFTKGVTHAGSFHADDVLSTCFLKLINPEFEIIRAFDAIPAEDVLNFDIGFGEFDHHQSNAEIRSNNVPYAAFGLIVRSFGHHLMSEIELAIFDEEFVQPIDSTDNGLTSNMFSSVISAFNPRWDETNSIDDRFWAAVDYAMIALKNSIDSIKSKVKAISVVEEALENSDGEIVVLNQFAPWHKVLVPSKAKLVVFPSNRGGYCAQVIPTTTDGMDSKVPFPVRWYGESVETLQKEIASMRFCHKNGFLLSCDELSDAIKACKIALKEFN